METLPSGHQYISPGTFLLKGDDKRYPSAHDVQIRLLKTIVFWDGAPAYVSQLYDDTKIVLWDLIPGSSNFVVDANDSRLEITSPRLGFFHYGSSAFYVCRRPLRAQRQGLDIDRLIYYDVGSGQWTNFARDEEVFKGFRSMLLQEYPQLSEILGQSGKMQRRAAAFSRTWAIRYTGSPKHYLLFHKTAAVGFFDATTKTFRFSPEERTRLRLNSLNQVLAKQYDIGGNYAIQ